MREVFARNNDLIPTDMSDNDEAEGTENTAAEESSENTSAEEKP